MWPSKFYLQRLAEVKIISPAKLGDPDHDSQDVEYYKSDMTEPQSDSLKIWGAKESSRKLQTAVESFFKDKSSVPRSEVTSSLSPLKIDTDSATRYTKEISDAMEYALSRPLEPQKLHEGIGQAGHSLKAFQTLYAKSDKSSLADHFKRDIERRTGDCERRLSSLATWAQLKFQKSWVHSRMWPSSIKDPLLYFVPPKTPTEKPGESWS